MRENDAVTVLRRPRVWWPWIIGALILAAAVAPQIWTQLIRADPTRWQVDLDVYRTAGQSMLSGRPVYEALTPPPQLLPFTYPPIAAVFAIVLALLPFGLVGWLWFMAQAACNVAIVAYAVAPLTRRCGVGMPIATAALAAVGLWLLPVSDGLRFGQVDAFLTLACLVDLVRRSPLRRGVLIGIATAIKLTPGLFVVHLLVTRQWRDALTAIATAAGLTLGAFVLVPDASFAFWGGALQNPERLGPNDGTANQSLRGLILRLAPGGATASALWLACAAAALVLGLGLARTAYRIGDRRLEVAGVALTLLLISPVSWIHHYDWMLVVLPVIALRVSRLLAAVLTVLLILPIPWWGHWRMDRHDDALAIAMNNAVIAIGVVSLGVLALAMRGRHWSRARSATESE